MSLKKTLERINELAISENNRQKFNAIVEKTQILRKLTLKRNKSKTNEEAWQKEYERVASDLKIAIDIISEQIRNKYVYPSAVYRYNENIKIWYESFSNPAGVVAWDKNKGKMRDLLFNPECDNLANEESKYAKDKLITKDIIIDSVRFSKPQHIKDMYTAVEEIKKSDGGNPDNFLTPALLWAFANREGLFKYVSKKAPRNPTYQDVINSKDDEWIAADNVCGMDYVYPFNPLNESNSIDYFFEPEQSEFGESKEQNLTPTQFKKYKNELSQDLDKFKTDRDYKGFTHYGVDLKDIDNVRPYRALNTSKQAVPSAKFNGTKNLFKGLGALILTRRDLFLKKANSINYNWKPNYDEEVFWTYVFYNAGQKTASDLLTKYLSSKKRNLKKFIQDNKNKSAVQNASNVLHLLKGSVELGIFEEKRIKTSYNLDSSEINLGDEERVEMCEASSQGQSNAKLFPGNNSYAQFSTNFSQAGHIDPSAMDGSLFQNVNGLGNNLAILGGLGLETGNVATADAIGTALQDAVGNIAVSQALTGAVANQISAIKDNLIADAGFIGGVTGDTLMNNAVADAMTGQSLGNTVDRSVDASYQANLSEFNAELSSATGGDSPYGSYEEARLAMAKLLKRRTQIDELAGFNQPPGEEILTDQSALKKYLDSGQGGFEYAMEMVEKDGQFYLTDMIQGGWDIKDNTPSGKITNGQIQSAIAHLGSDIGLPNAKSGVAANAHSHVRWLEDGFSPEDVTYTRLEKQSPNGYPNLRESIPVPVECFAEKMAA